MNYFAYDRMGSSVQMPNQSEMKKLISSAANAGVEHPDVSLNTDEGWCLSYNKSQIIILENVETGEGPWHLSSVGEFKALELWMLLSSGNNEKLMLEKWQEGYGN